MTPDSPTLTRVVLESELPDFIASLPPDLSARIVLCAKDDDGLYYNVRLEELTQARAELARRAEPVAWINADTLAALQKVKEGSALLSAAATTDETVPLYAAAPPVSAGDGREAFEAWALSRGYSVARGADAVETPIVDRYLSYATQHAWRGFEAALAWRDGGK